MITAKTVDEFIWGLLLLPPGLILWQSSIFRLSSHTGYHWAANIMFLLLGCVAVFTIGAIYYHRWGISWWIQWTSDFDSGTVVRLVQAIYLVLTMWLTGITLFVILIRVTLQRNLFSKQAKMDSGAVKGDHEELPLMGDTTLNVKLSANI